MEKKSKSKVLGVLLIFFVLVLVFSLGGLYVAYGSNAFTSQSTISIYKSCDEALQEKVNGVQVGQCFSYAADSAHAFTSASQPVQFVLSANEKHPAQGVFCGIETTTNSVYVNTCDQVIFKDGSSLAVCTSDADCPDGTCINHMCKPGGRGASSCTLGSSACLTSETYKTCLSSGSWSGILSCNHKTEQCLFNGCEPVICTIGDTKCVSTVLYQCEDGFTWSNKGNNEMCNPGNVPDPLNAQPYNPIYSCVPRWDCTSWSSCSNSQQFRVCDDLNNCPNDNNSPRPSESASCTSTNPENQPTDQEPFTPTSCVSYWDCSDWSTCNNNQQSRNCDDLNACPNIQSPTLTKTCGSTICDPRIVCTNWTECSHNVQNRVCTDVNNCGDVSVMPIQDQQCKDNLDPDGTGDVCAKGLTQCSDGSCKSSCTQTNNLLKNISLGGIALSIFMILLLVILMLVL